MDKAARAALLTAKGIKSNRAAYALGGSEDGIDVYHASPNGIVGKFKPSSNDVGIHFAANPDLARNAAVKSAYHKPRNAENIAVQKFRINAKPEQIVDIPQQGNRFDFYDILEHLHGSGRIDEGTFNKTYDKLQEIEDRDMTYERMNPVFSRALAKSNIKALRYMNEFDAGPTWKDMNEGRMTSHVTPDHSYMVTDPSAIEYPDDNAVGKSAGGAMEFARHVEAVNRAGGQIAPSKYLPNVPRAVHADGGKVDFVKDNPGGDWLANKQNYAFEYPRMKGIDGAITGWMGGKSDLFLPTHVLKSIEPLNNEKRVAGEPRFDDLMSSVSKEGFDPHQKGNKVVVAVNHRGKPFILEGNTRVAVAHAMGVPSVKAEVRYWNGAEEADGPMHPDKVSAMASSDPDITKAGGGEVDGEDDGIIAYHGSPHDFDQFDISKLGTGMGEQAYGKGLYFGGNEHEAKQWKSKSSMDRGSYKLVDKKTQEEISPVALGYKQMREPYKTLGSRLRAGDINHYKELWTRSADELEQKHIPEYENHGGLEDEVTKMRDDVRHLRAATNTIDNVEAVPQGHMYKVKLRVKPEELLDWHGRLADQNPIIQHIARNVDLGQSRGDHELKMWQQSNTDRAATGQHLYEALKRGTDENGKSTYDAENANKALMAHGLKGVRIHAYSGNKLGDPAHNYVMFHHDPVQVTDKYEYGGTVGKAGGGEMDGVDVNNQNGGLNVGTQNEVGTAPFNPAPRAQAGELRDAGRIRGGSGVLQTPDEAPLEGLLTPVKIPMTGQIIDAAPATHVRQVARDYMASTGLPYNPPKKYAKADPARSLRISDAYEAMKDNSSDPLTKASYAAMIKETMAQYHAAKAAGFKAEFWDPQTQEDPYHASPRLATEDIKNNNHMFVFPTDSGYGSDGPITAEQIKTNPLLQPSGETWNGIPVTVNDIFRAVHDYFGHAKEGVGFRADGEENAWRSHAAMYSPLARMAMTSETRGQNSWLNFNPVSGERNRKARTENSTFADQKVGILPHWVHHEGAEDFMGPEEVNAMAAIRKVHGRASGGSVDAAIALTRRFTKDGKAATVALKSKGK
jgi:hypothetical protein